MINPRRRHSDQRVAFAQFALVSVLVSILFVPNAAYVPVQVACPGWIEGTDSVVHHLPRAMTSTPTSAGASTPAAWTATTSPSLRPATMPIPQVGAIQRDTAEA
jgi:hypothetical protein